MHRCLVALASVFLTIGCHQPTAEEQARADIERLGGEVHRDGQMPGTPVVTVLLSGSRVTDGELAVLATFPQLRTLDLRKTLITNRGLLHLERLTKLQQLYLDATLINNAGLRHLEGLKELRKLSLSETKIDDVGLEFLKEMTNLEDVNIRETKASRRAVENLQKKLKKAVIRH